MRIERRAEPGRPDLGSSYAATCAGCHGTNGVAKAPMVALAGMSKDNIVTQMKAFKEGKRPATIMHQIAKGYTDEQVDLIATHFASQKP
ncbi:c-type cytochrome [Methylibium sp.]|uniref:c-type cytochrome n=1 Tax=Methylibium sp. TaxID=2067992 RepID=UPI00286D41A1|nr:c-type cytochrome [Methylibium sp.]